jgi:uncharacterized protein YukE
MEGEHRMTASPAMSGTGPGHGDPVTAQLLAELTSIGDAVRGQNSASGSGSAGLGQLAAADSPLSVLSDAGFDDVRHMVSFLEAPLSQLAGDPSSISSAAQDSLGAGDTMSTLAESYRASLGDQTTGWSGEAAEAYRSTGASYADGIAALGQAASTVSCAISSAGGAVAQTASDVRQDIADAAGQMLPILAAARAQAGTTNGASLAQAIPQCVRIAESYGQQIAARMRALLSNGQNLKEFVDKAIQLLNAVKQALSPQTGRSETGGTSQVEQGPGTGKTGSGQTGGQQSGSNTTQVAASTADKTSADKTSAGQSASSPTTTAASSPSATGQDDGTSGTTSDATDAAGYEGTSGSSALSTVPQSMGGGTAVPGSLASVLASSGGSATSGSGSRIRSTLGSPGLAGVGMAAGDSVAGGSGATAASTRGSAAEGTLGGPTTGARGGTRPEDKEHLSPDWLREDRGLFDPDEPVAPEVIDAPLGPDDEDDIMPPRRPEPVAERPAAAPPEPAAGAPPGPMTAEVLRRAATHPDAPPRLLRAADAVLEGKFTWEDVAGHQSQHPLAQALSTPKAQEKLWPMLRGVAEQIGKEKPGRPTPKNQAEPVDLPSKLTEERQR